MRLNRVVSDGTNRIGDIEYRVCEADAKAAIRPRWPQRRRWAGDTGGGAVAPVVATDPGPAQAGRELAVANRQTLTGPRGCSVQVTFAVLQTLFATFAQSYPGGPLTRRRISCAARR